MPLRIFLIASILFLFSYPKTSMGSTCSPDSGARLGHSIARIHQFIEKSRHFPSFNYDRLDFLLRKFQKREEAWAACGGPDRSRHDQVLRERLKTLRSRLAEKRALLPGASPAPISTIGEIDKLFAGLPRSDPSIGTQKDEKIDPDPQRRFPSIVENRGLLLGVVFLTGILVLLWAVRIGMKPKEILSMKEAMAEEFRRLGEDWAGLRHSRETILETMKQKIARGKKVVRLRAQLMKMPPGGKDWKVIDEIVQDDGGILRTFEEPIPMEESKEVVSETPLGEGEVRTRVVLPVTGEDGENMLLVVDALSAPEIEFFLPDPSGLRSHRHMKEVLSEVSHLAVTKGGHETIGVISFFFDDLEKALLLEREDQENLRDKEFIVGEIARLAEMSLTVFGESPGFFHVVVTGWPDSQIVTMIKKISEGFGPGSGKGESQLLERPWFRRILVAYTRWKNPDPEKRDQFLAQIQGNLDKLRGNPSIKTVVDA